MVPLADASARLQALWPAKQAVDAEPSNAEEEELRLSTQWGRAAAASRQLAAALVRDTSENGREGGGAVLDRVILPPPSAAGKNYQAGSRRDGQGDVMMSSSSASTSPARDGGVFGPSSAAAFEAAGEELIGQLAQSFLSSAAATATTNSISPRGEVATDDDRLGAGNPLLRLLHDRRRRADQSNSRLDGSIRAQETLPHPKQIVSDDRRRFAPAEPTPGDAWLLRVVYAWRTFQCLHAFAVAVAGAEEDRHALLGSLSPAKIQPASATGKGKASLRRSQSLHFGGDASEDPTQSASLINLRNQGLIRGFLEASFAFGVTALFPVNLRECFETVDGDDSVRRTGEAQGVQSRASLRARFPIDLDLPSSLDGATNQDREVLKAMLRMFVSEIMAIRRQHDELQLVIDSRHMQLLIAAVLVAFPRDEGQQILSELRETSSAYVFGESLFLLLNLPVSIPNAPDSRWRIHPRLFGSAISRELTIFVSIDRGFAMGFRTMCDLLIHDPLEHARQGMGSKGQGNHFVLSADTLSQIGQLSFVLCSPPSPPNMASVETVAHTYFENICTQLRRVINASSRQLVQHGEAGHVTFETFTYSENAGSTVQVGRHATCATLCCAALLKSAKPESLRPAIRDLLLGPFVDKWRLLESSKPDGLWRDGNFLQHIVVLYHFQLLSLRPCRSLGFGASALLLPFLECLDGNQCAGAECGLMKFFRTLFNASLNALSVGAENSSGGLNLISPRGSDTSRSRRAAAMSVNVISGIFYGIFVCCDEQPDATTHLREVVRQFCADVVTSTAAPAPRAPDAESGHSAEQLQMRTLRLTVLGGPQSAFLDTVVAGLFLTALSTFVNRPEDQQKQGAARVRALLFLSEIFAEVTAETQSGEQGPSSGLPEFFQKDKSLLRRVFEACDMVEFITLCNLLLQEAVRDLEAGAESVRTHSGNLVEDATAGKRDIGDSTETVELSARMLSFFLQSSSLMGKVRAENAFLLRKSAALCELLTDALAAAIHSGITIVDGLVSQVSEARSSLLALIAAFESGGSHSAHLAENGELSPVETRSDALSKILEEIRHPLLPVRAHALVALSKHVRAEANRQQHAGTAGSLSPASLGPGNFAEVHNDGVLDSIAQIFRSQLHDDDSFIFLAAIEGLSAVVDADPERFLPVLLEVFSSDGGTATWESRLKVGEALNNTIRRFGEGVSSHAAIIVDCLLAACHEPLDHSVPADLTTLDGGPLEPDAADHAVRDISSSLIRASALSNLAQVCKQLGFGLLPFVHDILETISKLLVETTPMSKDAGISLTAAHEASTIAENLVSQQQAAVEVRRGCCFVLYALFAGILKTENPTTFVTEELLPKYPQVSVCIDALQRIVDNVSGLEDPVAVLHAANAVGALAEVAGVKPSPLVQVVG